MLRKLIIKHVLVHLLSCQKQPQDLELHTQKKIMKKVEELAVA